MPDMIMLETEEKMEKSIESLRHELATVRTGRANPSILDKVMVDYYGTMTPLKQISTINVPEARQLMVKPYDKSSLSAVEKAINEANLGLVPNSDGEIIRINIPALTEERRREYVKLVKKYGEDCKVALRNVRRDGNEGIKKLDLPEDDTKGYQEDIQELTNKYSKVVEEIIKEKEKDLMSV